MGCFDTLKFKCRCGEKIDIQSKGGHCDLRNYQIGFDKGKLPTAVMGYVSGDNFKCPQCMRAFRVRTKTLGWVEDLE